MNLLVKSDGIGVGGHTELSIEGKPLNIVTEIDINIKSGESNTAVMKVASPMCEIKIDEHNIYIDHNNQTFIAENDIKKGEKVVVSNGIVKSVRNESLRISLNDVIGRTPRITDRTDESCSRSKILAK